VSEEHPSGVWQFAGCQLAEGASEKPWRNAFAISATRSILGSGRALSQALSLFHHDMWQLKTVEAQPCPNCLPDSGHPAGEGKEESSLANGLESQRMPISGPSPFSVETLIQTLGACVHGTIRDEQRPPALWQLILTDRAVKWLVTAAAVSPWLKTDHCPVNKGALDPLDATQCLSALGRVWSLAH
jgi:hypothetical protein